MVVGGRLRLSFGYSADRHRAETVQALADRYVAALTELVTPAPRDHDPLTPLQQGLLVDTLRQGPSTYLVQLELGLDGPLDPDAFAAAWTYLVTRHEVLRTSIHWEGRPEPVQQVHADVELPVVVEDWRDESDVEARLTALLATDRAQGFDLTRAPLLRVRLLRTADESHLLVVSLHHLVLDGWSSARLLGELFEAYAALRSGSAPQLPAVTPFRSYLDWLAAQDEAAAEAYWHRRLEGFDGPAAITGIAATPAAVPADDPPAEVFVELPAADTAALTEFARRHRLTPGVLAYAAWACVLRDHRTSPAGEDDVLFGVTLAGRPAELPGVESMVGLFITTLPLRVTLPAEDGLLDWLHRLQDEVQELGEYAYSSLADVQRLSGVSHGRRLFDSVVVVENYPTAGGSAAADAGLTVTQRGVRERTDYPLTCGVTVTDRLLVRLSYRPDLVEGADAAALAERLLVALRGLVESPDRAVGDLSVLAPEERRRVLTAGNDTGPGSRPPPSRPWSPPRPRVRRTRSPSMRRTAP